LAARRCRPASDQEGAMTTPEDLKRKAEAVYQWAQRHHADAAPECPVCRGVKWVFRLDPPGPYVPRVCMSCGYVQLFDAVLLGVEPPPAPAEYGRAAKGGPPGKDG
jgi:hypothetical protein